MNNRKKRNIERTIHRRTWRGRSLRHGGRFTVRELRERLITTSTDDY